MRSFSPHTYQQTDELHLSLTVGFPESQQNIQRLKAMLDLVVEEAVLEFARRASEEIGVVIDGYACVSTISLASADAKGFEQRAIMQRQQLQVGQRRENTLISSSHHQTQTMKGAIQ